MLCCYIKHYDVNGYVVDKHVDVANDVTCSKKNIFLERRRLQSTVSRITDLSLDVMRDIRTLAMMSQMTSSKYVQGIKRCPQRLPRQHHHLPHQHIFELHVIATSSTRHQRTMDEKCAKLAFCVQVALMCHPHGDHSRPC